MPSPSGLARPRFDLQALVLYFLFRLTTIELTTLALQCELHVDSSSTQLESLFSRAPIALYARLRNLCYLLLEKHGVLNFTRSMSWLLDSKNGRMSTNLTRQSYGLYTICSDLPLMVVQVHVQRVFHTYSKPDIVTEARKLMHRFTEDEVEALLDEAEGNG